MTDHIRWSNDSGGRIIGRVGTLDLARFVISAPLPGQRHGEWLLISRLPGQESVTVYDDYPESLTERAEELVAEFVSSLGAVFPDEAPPAGEGEQS